MALLKLLDQGEHKSSEVIHGESKHLSFDEFSAVVLLNVLDVIWSKCYFATQVVLSGFYVKRPAVEVYLTELKLYEESNPAKSFFVEFSKADSIGKIKDS